MNKLDKFLRRFAYKIEFSESKQSRYYTIGDLIVRVSDHIGKNSDGNIHFIIDRHNYILFIPITNKVSVISCEECKTLIKGIVLHSSLFLVGDPQFQKSLIKENEELKMQIQVLKRELNNLKNTSPNNCISNTSLSTIKTLLVNLTNGQKKRIKSIYGSNCFDNMNNEQLQIIWKNPEVQKYIQQNKNVL